MSDQTTHQPIHLGDKVSHKVYSGVGKVIATYNVGGTTDYVTVRWADGTTTDGPCDNFRRGDR